MDNKQNERSSFSVYIKRFLPEEIIFNIQYCLLRVPFLLVYDYLFTKEFYFSVQSFIQYTANHLDQENGMIVKLLTILFNSFFFQLLLSIVLLVAIPVLGFILLMVLLLCSNRRLLIIYSYIISCFVIYFFYQLNYAKIREKNRLFLQLILSLTYLQMLNIYSHNYLHKIQKFFPYFSPILFIFTCYLLPLNISTYLLTIYCNIWLLINIFDLILSTYDKIKTSLTTDFYNELWIYYENFSINLLVTYLQEHIHLSILLKIFWLTKVLIVPLGVRTIYSNPYIITDNQANYDITLNKTIYFTCLYYGTETVFT